MQICLGLFQSSSPWLNPQLRFIVMHDSHPRPSSGGSAVMCCSGVLKSSGSFERLLMTMPGWSLRELSEMIAREVARGMIACRRGKIINICSVMTEISRPTISAYCASKYAVMGLTESLALEGFPLGIRVNALCPGPTATPMRRDNFPDEDQNRLLAANEVAQAALYFFTDAARYVRNAALDVRKQPRGWHS